MGDEWTSRIFLESSQEQHGTMSTVLRERDDAEVDSRDNRTTDNAEIYIVNRVHCLLRDLRRYDGSTRYLFIYRYAQ